MIPGSRSHLKEGAELTLCLNRVEGTGGEGEAPWPGGAGSRAPREGPEATPSLLRSCKMDPTLTETSGNRAASTHLDG